LEISPKTPWGKMMRDTMIICHENILQNSMGKINRKWNNIHEYACVC
jgi:hypothetical protein